MSMAEALARYFRVETNSTILPYIVRDHAWNMDGHDMSGSFFRYRDDAPDGYKEHMDFECPHPTNFPNGDVECGEEHDAEDDEEDDDAEVCAEGDDECEAEAAEDEDDEDADEDDDEDDDDEDDDADDEDPEFEDDGEDDEADDDEVPEDDDTLHNVTIPDEFHQKSKPSFIKSKDPQPIGKLLKEKKDHNIGGSRFGDEHKKPVMAKPVKNLVKKHKKIHNPKNKYFDELRAKNLIKENAPAAEKKAAAPAPTPKPIMKAVEEMNRKMGVKKVETEAPKKVEAPAPKPVEQPAQAKTEVKKAPEGVRMINEKPAEVAKPIPAKNNVPSLTKVAKPVEGVRMINEQPA
jgi:hypothetical protein